MRVVACHDCGDKVIISANNSVWPVLCHACSRKRSVPTTSSDDLRSLDSRIAVLKARLAALEQQRKELINA